MFVSVHPAPFPALGLRGHRLPAADASKLVKFKVEADAKIAELPTPTEPSLFYSRPKGDYKGEETKTLLLDFFVSNATLGADSYKVKANINGQDFTLDQWVPYEILNLPLDVGCVSKAIPSLDRWDGALGDRVGGKAGKARSSKAV